MKMRFAVMGAGGHSREVADLIVACGHEIGWFVDDQIVGLHHPTGIAVRGTFDGLQPDAVTVAIGEPSCRERIWLRIRGDMELPALVHPSASVSPYASIGAGTQVMQNAVVSASALVGQNVILNVGCFVAHDCVVGAHSHVAPNAVLSGGSSVGERCTIGAGAIILPRVVVGAGCTIGAGAVVTRDVSTGATAMGVPARATDTP